jgi:hypothetical protein
MSTEFPHQPDDPVNRPPAQAFPPPVPREAEAVDWAPPPWANRPVAEPPSDPGSIAGWAPPPWTAGPDTQAGWTPPPWSPDAADTRPFWRRIPTVWLEIAGALVLVGAVVGWYFIGVATGEPEVAPAQPTQVRTGVATPDKIDESEDLNRDEINIDDSDDLRVGDCFDLKHPYAEIEHVMRSRAQQSTSSSFSTSGRWASAATRPSTRSRTTWSSTATPRSVTISARRPTIPTSTTTGWSRPTMPGDRAIGPCSAPPTIRITLA